MGGDEQRYEIIHPVFSPSRCSKSRDTKYVVQNVIIRPSKIENFIRNFI